MTPLINSKVQVRTTLEFNQLNESVYLTLSMLSTVCRKSRALFSNCIRLCIAFQTPGRESSASLKSKTRKGGKRSTYVSEVGRVFRSC